MIKHLFCPAIVFIAMLLALAGPQAARAQLSLGPDTTPARSLADEFAMLSRLALQSNTTVADHQWTLSRLLLNAALTLNKQDAELWRMSAELARETSDRQTQAAALRAYCTLEPDDTAAQYQWITTRLMRAQTLEERTQLVQRLLGADSAGQLHPRVRSRLASYLASAAAEQGDGPAVQKYLKQAMELDPINPIAAELMYELASRRPTPAPVQGQVLITLLQAQPTAPSVRLLMARWLADQQAYQAATAQFEAASRLSGTPMQPDHARDWAAAMVAMGQADQAIEQINQQEATLRALLAQQRRAAEAQAAREAQESGVAPPPAPESQADLTGQQVLPPEVDAVRMMAAFALGRDTLLEATYARMKPEVLGDENAADPLRDLAWLSVLTNRDLDAARDWLSAQPQPESKPESKPDAEPNAQPDAIVARIAGWLAWREGRLDEATALLRPIARTDGFAALGLAQVLAQAASPRDPERQGLLRAIALAEPMGLAGIAAAAQLVQLDDALDPSPGAVAVVDALRALPSRVAEPDLQRLPWIDAEIELGQQRYRQLDPMTATITLTNRSGMDLPIASEANGGHGIPALASLIITPRRVGQDVGNLPPLIVDLARQLVLEKGQTITMPVRLDRTGLAALIANIPTETINFSVMLVYDPRWVPGQVDASGPLGETATTNPRQNWAMPATGLNVERWVSDVTGPDPLARLAAIARLAPIAPRLAENDDTRDSAQRIAQAINEQFPRLDPVMQAWTVRFIPPNDTGKVMFEPALTLAARSASRTVRLMHLHIHATEPDGAIINAGLRSDDDVIQAMAQAKQQQLRAQQAAEEAQAAVDLP